MFFFNGRIRNPHIVPVVTIEPTYTNKVSQSVIIAGCLTTILGLIFLLIGFISETDKSMYFGLGSIIIVIGLVLSILTCFYTELNSCYQTWAYGSTINPSTIESSTLATTADITVSYFPHSSSVSEKIRTQTLLSQLKSSKIPKTTNMNPTNKSRE